MPNSGKRDMPITCMCTRGDSREHRLKMLARFKAQELEARPEMLLMEARSVAAVSLTITALDRSFAQRTG